VALFQEEMERHMVELSSRLLGAAAGVCVCVCVCACVGVGVCARVLSCMCACMRACVRVSVYVWQPFHLHV